MHALGAVLSATSPVGAFDDFWYEPQHRGGYGPGSIDPEAAMTIPAFYAAVTYVAEDIAKIPLSMYEDLDEKGNAPAQDHELQELLHYQPNRRQDAIEWREMATAWAMLRGKAVNEILPGSTLSYPGEPTRSSVFGQIVPLHPDLVREERTATGETRFIYRDPLKKGAERTILGSDAFVVRGRQSRSVLDFAASNLRTILNTDRYAGFMFQRGAKHQGVLKAKGRLPEPVRKSLRKALNEYSIDGPRAGRPLLLEDGMEWENVSMTMADAQLLESQQWSISQICRWIRIPPHKIFDLTRSTNNNIEAQGIDYITDCLLAWAVRWEQAIRRDLIVDRARFFAKHTLDGLLRGDFEARSKAYALAIGWGWMTRNEVRAKEDMNPLDGLSAPLTPANMVIGADGSTSLGYADTQAIGSGSLLELPAGERGHILGVFAADAASRVVRREVNAMEKLAERTAGDAAAWRAGVAAHYADFAAHVAETMHVPDHVARQYTREQSTSLLEGGADVMNDWLEVRAAHLAHLGAADKMPQEIAA